MTFQSRPVTDKLAHPKGREVDAVALGEVHDLIGLTPPPRDRLIEVLHVLQDRHGCLHARHLRALADIMALSQAEIFETASFYHDFDLVPDGAPAPPAIKVGVCTSVTCHLRGADRLKDALSAATDPARVRVTGASCLGLCEHAPAAMVNGVPLPDATEETLARAILHLPSPSLPAYIGLSTYRESGGYALPSALQRGERSPESVIATLSDAGLRGLGGAGFPAGRKWAAVRAQPAPRVVTVNADEGEPGTFKDRHILEQDPHRMLEGALIAARCVEAERIVVYVRNEYPVARAILAREIAALRQTDIVSGIDIDVRRGAGAYICGEESAMIESIEGKRGWPRHRPPYIAESGLFGRPTLNHNVETLAWVRDIVEKGPAWFTGHGRRGRKGLRSFSVSGRVRAPGVKLAPAGVTARELIEEFSGGMAEGHRLLGYLPGGASGGILPARLADEPLDFGTLDAHGCFVGSHAVVVFSDKDDPRDIARNLMAFFAAESCGQCTPCRVGTQKMLTLMQADNWDEPLMSELEALMRDASICGLGQAAPNPVRSVLRFFRETADDR